MRIRRIIQRWDEFSENAVMVAVFDAKIGELQKRMKNTTLHSLLLQMKHMNSLHRIKKSFFKFMWGAMRSPLTPSKSYRVLGPTNDVHLQIIDHPS